MLTLTEVQTALQDRRLPAVAAATGLAYDTVRRVANGDVAAVSYDTVKRLSDYLEGNQTQDDTDHRNR